MRSGTNNSKFSPRSMAAWTLSLLILGYLFYRIDLAQTWVAVVETSNPAALLVPVLLVFVIFFFDTVTLYQIFNRVNCRVAIAPLLRIRGALTFFSILNYNISHLGIIQYIHNRSAVPHLEGISSILFRNFMDTILIGLIGLLGASLLRFQVIPWIVAIATAVSALLIGLTLFLHYRSERVFAKNRPNLLALTKAFRLCTWRFLCAYIPVRLCYFAVGILLVRTVLRLFDIEPGFLHLLAFMPLLSMISTFPITLARLGPGKAASLWLFTSFAAEPRILAFNLLIDLIFLTAYTPIGLLGLKLAEKDIDRDILRWVREVKNVNSR
ncbi:hypothetical protein ACFL4G_06950 [Thermodesulfobacteriota bacterium]